MDKAIRENLAQRISGFTGDNVQWEQIYYENWNQSATDQYSSGTNVLFGTSTSLINDIWYFGDMFVSGTGSASAGGNIFLTGRTVSTDSFGIMGSVGSSIALLTDQLRECLFQGVVVKNVKSSITATVIFSGYRVYVR